MAGFAWFWRDDSAITAGGAAPHGARYAGVGGDAGGEDVWVTPRGDLRVVDPGSDRPGASAVPRLLMIGLAAKIIGAFFRALSFDWRSILAECVGAVSMWIAISAISQRIAAPLKLDPLPSRRGVGRMSGTSSASSAGARTHGGASIGAAIPSQERFADTAGEELEGLIAGSDQPRDIPSAGIRSNAASCMTRLASGLPSAGILTSPWHSLAWLHGLARWAAFVPGMSAEWGCVGLALAASMDLVNASGSMASLVVLR